MSQSLACGGPEQIPGIDIQLSRKYHTTNKVRIISAFYVQRVLSHRCSLNLSKIVSWMRQGTSPTAGEHRKVKWLVQGHEGGK